MTLASPLPRTWTPEKDVRFTALILEEPDHTETKTILRHGLWKITLSGYRSIEMGKKYTFVGRVTPRLLLGKVMQIDMMEPTFEKIYAPRIKPSETLLLLLMGWRSETVRILQYYLPEPHAALSAGILLGIKGSMPQTFYRQLVTTGTLHVIAASGYNVSIVARVVMVPLLTLFPRGYAVVGALAAVFAYVIFAGGSAAVVRAGIMGTLTLIAYYFGRPAEAKRLLWVAAVLMLLVNPRMIADAGFQLSLAATGGILYLEPGIRTIGDRLFYYRWVRVFLRGYLYPTLAATVATLPVILITFGRVSWLSPLVNMLILPLVPLIMLLTAIAVMFSSVPGLAQVSGWILYVPLELFVLVIRLFG